jgi:predicted Zn-dependent protease
MPLMPVNTPWRHRRRPLTAALVAGVGLALATLAGVWISGCAVNPATGKKQISIVSRSQEIQMGREGDREILAHFGVYEDSSLADYVEQIGQQLAAVSELPNLDWHFRILNSPVVNAFALPGGYIYVSRGILAILNSEAQLAGVIGHEIGHVTARHTAQRITQSQLAQIGLGLGMILVPNFGRYTPMASASLSLLFLKYGRDDETQADELGIRYAVKAGYDPREIPATYAALKRIGQKQITMLPGYLSTHPDPGDREQRTAYISEAAAAANPGARLVGREEYFHHIEGLAFGEDPRGGFVRDGVFYHPQMAFEVIFPSGWEVINTAAAVIASNPRSQSAIQLTITSSEGVDDPDEFVDKLYQRGEVVSFYKLHSMVGGWPAWVGAVEFSQGQAREMWVAWVAREPGYYYQFMAIPRDEVTHEYFRQTLRTFRELTDPEILNRGPDWVHVAEVELPSATIGTVAESFPRLAVPVEEVALLNNMWDESIVHSGERLKVVLKSDSEHKKTEE